MSVDNHVGSAGATPSVSTGVVASHDDPRLASALAAYLAELEAGRRPSREQWLEEHPEIAETLGDWFDIVEFVHSAAESAYSSRSHAPSQDSLPPETLLGEYRLVREIARGGMAIVYEAQQVSLGRRVALKVLAGTAALDPLKLQRFRVETQAVAQLNHAHIVPIFAVGSEQGSHFYAMQYIEGPTLAELIRQQRAAGSSPKGEPSPPARRPSPARQRPAASGLIVNGVDGGARELSPSTVTPAGTTSVRTRRAFRAIAKLAIQAADALAHAHSMGILHRDIKPSNLLIDSRGNLWVTDFGLARFQDEPGVTRTGDLLGTLRYMAPELVLGHGIVHDPRSDIYSLGATLYELLTLKPVFDGRDRQELLRQIAQDEPVAPAALDPAIPRDLETIVLKAMDKDPERRYHTAQELADDLGRFLEDKPVLARRPTSADRAAKWARRHRAVLGATGGVGFLALAIAAPVLWWEQRATAQANDNPAPHLPAGRPRIRADRPSFRRVDHEGYVTIRRSRHVSGSKPASRELSSAMPSNSTNGCSNRPRLPSRCKRWRSGVWASLAWWAWATLAPQRIYSDRSSCTRSCSQARHMIPSSAARSAMLS